MFFWESSARNLTRNLSKIIEKSNKNIQENPLIWRFDRQESDPQRTHSRRTRIVVGPVHFFFLYNEHLDFLLQEETLRKQKNMSFSMWSYRVQWNCTSPHTMFQMFNFIQQNLQTLEETNCRINILQASFSTNRDMGKDSWVGVKTWYENPDPILWYMKFHAVAYMKLNVWR